jgi:hypothetical protein
MAQNSIYEIKLYNEQTKRYHFLARMTADSPEEAKAMFLKRNNYKARDGFRLFVKSPGCL